jgi:uncharacterized protein (TIGR02598 family)
MNIKLQGKLTHLRAFSLIEVVLAMGIFLITVLALVGLMGPALKSVSTVKTTDEVASVVDTVNAFLNTSPYIDIPAGANNPGDPAVPRFDAIYSAIEDDGYATLFVYRWHDNGIIRLEVGYENNQNNKVNDAAVVNVDRAGDGIQAAAFNNADSSIYRVVLTASSAMLPDPDNIVSANRTGSYLYHTLTYSIDRYINDFNGRYLALEVRIFSGDRDPYGPDDDVDSDGDVDLDDLANEVPIIAYDIAILR